ncbi:hypothetical protein WJX72_007885 [[Myrmecia] bisecta]|uniref:MYND-type domain-containing protein n=1 Tax=[Myrmecia] bisecta TaxID=41462 RepID=A0AAW1QFM5_9CHLO
MAAMHEDEPVEEKECGNCGVTEGLLLCSRCHGIWFCSVKCQKAYWPFHQVYCKRNEFADLVESSEPKFARWMRKHGKMAVLKDNEVERLERAAVANIGYSRQEVMESMYGRLEPRPAAPTYTAHDQLLMRDREEQDLLEARMSSKKDQGWKQIEVAPDLGVACDRYKWQQNQTYVEIYLRLPAHSHAKQVQIELRPRHIQIVCNERVLLKGELYQDIKVEESTWLIKDGILEVLLLKRNRRGNYADGTTNADTFWKSVLKTCAPAEAIQLQYPPASYYKSFLEVDEVAPNNRIRGRRHDRPMIDRSKERRQ